MNPITLRDWMAYFYLAMYKDPVNYTPEDKETAYRWADAELKKSKP